MAWTCASNSEGPTKRLAAELAWRGLTGHDGWLQVRKCGGWALEDNDR